MIFMFWSTKKAVGIPKPQVAFKLLSPMYTCKSKFEIQECVLLLANRIQHRWESAGIEGFEDIELQIVLDHKKNIPGIKRTTTI